MNLYGFSGGSFFLMLFLAACSPAQDVPASGSPQGQGNASGQEWLIPQNKVLDGGVGKDGIPAIDDPEMVSVSSATYIDEDELVVGILGPDGPRAYPHKVLDWHEIVNDGTEAFPYAIVYCPLTGTGTAWSRELAGATTTFGVSGLLYQNNIIPYDRATNSLWSQVGNLCFTGPLVRNEPEHFPVFEASWKTWKTLFPGSQVLSDQTGFDRNYNFYPYFDYKENHQKIPFPLETDDTRLPRKERVLGVVIDETGPRVGARVYRFSSLAEQGITVINDFVKSDPIVVVGSQEAGFMVAFSALYQGTLLDFRPVQGEGAVVLEDQEATRWNVFGLAVSGPRKGAQLASPPLSFMGYWFAWGAFYPGIEIYSE